MLSMTNIKCYLILLCLLSISACTQLPPSSFDYYSTNKLYKGTIDWSDIAVGSESEELRMVLVVVADKPNDNFHQQSLAINSIPENLSYTSVDGVVVDYSSPAAEELRYVVIEGLLSEVADGQSDYNVEHGYHIDPVTTGQFLQGDEFRLVIYDDYGKVLVNSPTVLPREELLEYLKR